MPLKSNPKPALDIVRRFLLSGWQIMEFVGREKTRALVEQHQADNKPFPLQRQLVYKWVLERNDARSDIEKQRAIDSALEAALSEEPDFLEWLEENTISLDQYRAVNSPEGVEVYPPLTKAN